MSHKSMVEDLKTLVVALEEERTKPSTLVQGSALQVNDMSEKFGNLFSPAAAEALKTRFKTVIFPRPEIKTLFLSATAKSEAGIEKAAKSIAQDVNLIAAMGQLRGCLCPLSTLKLQGTCVNALTYAETAVFCFITVPWEFEPSEWTGQLMDLYKNEGEISTMIFE